MIIPKLGDWVDCPNRDSFGKVTQVNLDKGTFLADFFTEWSSDEDIGGTEECEERINSIKAIVIDPEKIRELEEELSGELIERLKENES